MTMKTGQRLSFEFFPPKTPAGMDKLLEVRKCLSQYNPEFFSVTYGAGGSTRDNTRAVVSALREQGIDIAPHLSFGGDTEDKLKQMIADYRDLGVTRIVALRGDMTSGMGGSHQMVYANELVAFIRREFGDHFHLEVAAYPEIHPEAKTYDDDIRYLKGKFDAGANSALTQYFYNPDAYFCFIEECEKIGIDKPIYPGIMPILNVQNLLRFSHNCGAEIPRWLQKRLLSYADDPISLQEFGIDMVTELCRTLVENGAPGLHFYTMNQSETVCRILDNL